MFPLPDARLWPVLAGVWAIHTIYKALQTQAYVFGAYTVVYPVARGAGTVFTVLFAWIALGEAFSAARAPG